MAQTAEKVIEFPAGGIADFYMEDDEIASLEREEARRAFGDNGIANFSDVANRMASYGRGGDDTLAHVATGEIVIPLPLIDNNPAMKASIFKHLEELGVEDPEQYVVGSSANSINPETGLREFGWLKKTFRKVSRAVKSVGKSVVKLIKKAAPIVLPIALSFTPLGAIYGAALGSGIGTLIQGGSIKDAFKSALIAGATGAVFKGLGNKLSGQGTFMEGVNKAAANPMGRITQTASGLGSTLSGGGFTGQGNLFSDFVPTSTAVDSVVPDTTDLASKQFAADTGDLQLASADGLPAGTDIPTTNAPVGETDAARFLKDQARAADAAKGPVPDYAKKAMSNVDSSFLTKPPVDPTGGGSNFLDTAKEYYDTASDYLVRGGQSKQAIAEAAAGAEQKAIQNTLVKYGQPAGPITNATPPSIAAKAIAAGEAAAASAQPGMLATYGPSLALAGTAAYAGGMFDTPEEPSDEELLAALGPSGYELYKANKAQYGLKAETPQYAQGPIAIPTTFSQGLLPLPPLAVAEGGEIFPRRVGGIMPNEGTPGKDSVRAMLMPGEFVMTTDAVRGLGNGNNDQGIRNMYDMMRGLEAKGRATA